MENQFPVDIWSLKQFPHPFWRDKFTWPVSDMEYRQLAHDIEATYTAAVDAAPPSAQPLLAAAYKITTPALQLCHKKWVEQRLQVRGLVPRFDPQNRLWRGSPEPSSHALGTFQPLPTPSQKRNARLASLKTSFSGLSRKRELLTKSAANCWQKITPHQRAYATHHGLRPHLTLPAEWLPHRGTPPDARLVEQAPRLTQAAADFFQRLEKLAAARELPLAGASELDSLHQSVANWLIEFQQNVYWFEQALNSHSPHTFLINNIGQPTTRAFCLAARQTGHTVVGFPHGHNFGQDSYSLQATNELTIVNRYCAPTESSRQLFEKHVAHYTSLLKQPVTVEQVPFQYWPRLLPEFGQTKPPSAIRRVMIIEYPMTPQRHAGINQFWAYQFKTLVKTAQVLKALNIEAVIKCHPDRLEESRGLYGDLFDGVLHQPFEEVYDQADAFLFTYLGSTTLGFSWLTDKPILTFAPLLEDLWPEARQLLEQRYWVIPATWDTHGELVFETEDVAERLRAPFPPLDHTFARRVLIPAQVNGRSPSPS